MTQLPDASNMLHSTATSYADWLAVNALTAKIKADHSKLNAFGELALDDDSAVASKAEAAMYAIADNSKFTISYNGISVSASAFASMDLLSKLQDLLGLLEQEYSDDYWEQTMNPSKCLDQEMLRARNELLDK